MGAMFRTSSVLYGLLAFTLAEPPPITVEIDPQGKAAKLSLSWQDVLCVGRIPATKYNIIVSNANTTLQQTLIGNNITHTDNGLVKTCFEHLLKPWRHYTVQIDGDCFIRYKPVGKKDFISKHKDLMPPVNVTAVAGDHSAIIKWNEQEGYESAPQTVSIELCKKKKSQGKCREPYTIYKSKGQYELTNLGPGVEYEARFRLQLTYEEENSTTPALLIPVQALPPDAQQYPPPQIKVKVDHKIDSAVATVTPSLSGGLNRKICGIVLKLANHHGEIIQEQSAADKQPVLFRNLPYLSHLEVRAHTVYEVSGDAVSSPESIWNFTTGVGANISEIDCPRIERIEPLSDTDVFVEWTHKFDLSDDLVYVIFYGDRNKTVPYSASSTVLRGLLPRFEYQVSILAQIEFNGTCYKSALDTRKVDLPREGVLSPQWNKKPNVTSEGIELSWNYPDKMEFPKYPSNCTQIIETCVTEERCQREIDIKLDKTEALSPFFEFEFNNVTVAIICRYGEEVIKRSSSSIHIFGGFAPSPPVAVTGKANISAIFLTFEPSEHVNFTTGYEIKWIPVNANRSAEWSRKRISANAESDIIEHLEPCTNYNVSVAAFVLSLEEYLGVPVFVNVTTEFPEPPNISNLTVRVQDYKDILEIDWVKPDYKCTALKYQVNVTCRARTHDKHSTTVTPQWTNMTDIQIKIEAKRGDICTVGISASNSFSSGTNLPVKTGGVTTKDINYEGIPLPKDIKMVKRDYKTLWLKVEGPNSLKNVFRFKLAKREDPYKNESADADTVFTVTDLQPYTHYEIKACACVGTLCSDDLIKSIRSNAAAPGRVENLRSRAVKQKILVDWNAPKEEDRNGPIDGYFLQVEDLEDGTVQYFNSTKRKMDLDVAKEHAWYCISVEAVNFDVTSGSQTVYAGVASRIYIKTGGDHPPPVNVTSVKTMSDSVELSWAHASTHDFNIKFFRLIMARRKIPTTKGVALGTPEDPDVKTLFTEVAHISVNSLKPYTNYIISVAACSRKEICSRERIMQLTTAPSHPSKPHSFIWTEHDSSKVTVSWEPPEEPAGPLDGYEICAFTKGTTHKHWRLLTKTATKYTFTDLDDGDYIIQLRAFNYDSSRKSDSNTDKRATMLFSEVARVEIFITAKSAFWQVAGAVVIFIGLAFLGYVTYIKKIRSPSPDSLKLVTNEQTNPVSEET